MKVVALISGGKDSCYNMMQCVAEGHDLIALANLRPKTEEDGVSTVLDELDSYMYQTVGHHAIQLYADAMGLPLYRGLIDGSSRHTGSNYLPTAGDEVEDLYKLLKKVKDVMGVEAVSVGAILSNYQRVRVENVCSRLGLTPLAFLWQRDQEELLQEMITAGVEAIIIKVAALGLTSEHLGMTLQEIQPHMMRMKEKYQLNVCGEGGEFETFTLDCPLFAKKIRVKHWEVINHSDDAFAPVLYLNLLNMELEDKQNVKETFADRLKDIPMKRGRDILQELEDLTVEELPESQDLAMGEDGSRQCSAATETSNLSLEKYISEKFPRICKTTSEGYLWISGITAVQSNASSFTKDIEQAMDSLKELLVLHRYQLSDAAMVHLYVRDMSNFVQINSVYCRYFQLNPPARVCIQADLPCDTMLQMDCMAYRNTDQDSSDITETAAAPVHRHTMHVQGISHWAPANIGPYSQAVQIGHLIYSAGAIPLCPSTMQTIEGGITPQCALSLRSLQRVLAAMHPGVSLSNVIGGVCYVTDGRHLDIARKHWEKFLRTTQEDSSCSRVCRTMSYVIVPHLPKGVLVEWHVVAGADSESWQHSSQRVQGQALFAELQVILDVENSSGFVVCDVTTNTKPEPRVLVNELLDAIGACLKENSFSWNSALCVRFFYRQSLAGHGHLLNALTAEFDKLSSATPAVCLVPVLGLPGSHVITALVFLKR